MSQPIHLNPHQASIVERLVSAGRYATADEAIVEALKLLDARETHLQELRDAWHEGVASGDYEPLDPALDELTARYAARADTGI